MIDTTTASSSPIEDIKRARHLAFDPSYYDAIRGSVFDDDSTGFLCQSNADTSGLEHKFSLIPEPDMASLGTASYVIKRSSNDDGGETLPRKDPEISLSDLIDRFRHHPKIGHGERVADRLYYLLAVSREEQPEQAPPTAASLKSFLGFLSQNSRLAYPNLVLTPEGNIRAEWRINSDKRFAVEFLDDDDVRFVIFAPDPKRPYKTARVSGTATIDSVMGQAEYYHVLDWVKAENERTA